MNHRLLPLDSSRISEPLCHQQLSAYAKFGSMHMMENAATPSAILRMFISIAPFPWLATKDQEGRRINSAMERRKPTVAGSLPDQIGVAATEEDAGCALPQSLQIVFALAHWPHRDAGRVCLGVQFGGSLHNAEDLNSLSP